MALQLNGTVGDNELEWMFTMARRQYELERRWTERVERHQWWNLDAPKDITNKILKLWRVLLLIEHKKRIIKCQPGVYVVNGRRLKIK